jgi:hypothetical protein
MKSLEVAAMHWFRTKRLLLIVTIKIYLRCNGFLLVHQVINSTETVTTVGQATLNHTIYSY